MGPHFNAPHAQHHDLILSFCHKFLGGLNLSSQSPVVLLVWIHIERILSLTLQVCIPPPLHNHGRGQGNQQSERERVMTQALLSHHSWQNWAQHELAGNFAIFCDPDNSWGPLDRD